MLNVSWISNRNYSSKTMKTFQDLVEKGIWTVFSAEILFKPLHILEVLFTFLKKIIKAQPMCIVINSSEIYFILD